MSVVRRSCAPPDAREDEAPGRPNEDWEDDAGEGVRGGLNSVCEALLADAGEKVGGVDCVWGEAEEPFHTWPLSFAGHVFFHRTVYPLGAHPCSLYLHCVPYERAAVPECPRTHIWNS